MTLATSVVGTEPTFQPRRKHVRFEGRSGRSLSDDAASTHDPNVWSGRALQEDFVELADVRSCINVSGL
jgi:hypothetical protein